MIEFPKYIFIDDSTVIRTNVPNVVRSDMEVGPQKTRRIQNTPLFNVAFSVSFAKHRFTEFQLWYRNDINAGTAWFLMNDPMDGIERRFRFVNTELEFSRSANLIRTSFVLEAYDVIQSGL